MAKVFIVTSGEYSDYGIDRVFSTRKLAEQYVDTKDDDWQIEEYELDEPIERETHIFAVRMSIRSKEVERCSISSCLSKKDCIEYYERGLFENPDPRIIFYIESDSKERAIKIASERFGAVIANEKIVYEHLRERIVLNKVFCIPEYEYPLYNFINGNVVLLDKFELVEGVIGVNVEFRETKYE